MDNKHKLAAEQKQLYANEKKQSESQDRGFQLVTKYLHHGITMPYRTTKYSAAYDIKAAKTMTIPSVPRMMWEAGMLSRDNKSIYSASATLRHLRCIDKESLGSLRVDRNLNTGVMNKLIKSIKPVLVPTGIKSFMQPNEALLILNRSSNPLKRGLYLANNVGLIDPDYYNSDKTEGEIFAQMVEFGPHDYTIHKGDRIVQGMFINHLVATNDHHSNQQRHGGLGSTKK